MRRAAENSTSEDCVQSASPAIRGVFWWLGLSGLSYRATTPRRMPRQNLISGKAAFPEKHAFEHRSTRRIGPRSCALLEYSCVLRKPEEGFWKVIRAEESWRSVRVYLAYSFSQCCRSHRHTEDGWLQARARGSWP